MKLAVGASRPANLRIKPGMLCDKPKGSAALKAWQLAFERAVGFGWNAVIAKKSTFRGR
jgi:hypothetical protein